MKLHIEENSGFPFVASGLIITLSERQITRAEANRIKAAGTRLFVGGFLTTHDGIPLSTNSGHLIACAGGPYDTIEISDGSMIEDEDGDGVLVDEYSDAFIIDENAFA